MYPKYKGNVLVPDLVNREVTGLLPGLDELRLFPRYRRMGTGYRMGM